MDDFAWLALHTQVNDFDSFVRALFEPMAQGTVRPLSERLFFLGFWQLFGMEALPYRLLVFGTQFLNLVLLSVVTRRLTGSAVAGFLAPLLWLLSPVIYEPLVWTSAYNQILCSFFFLLDFYLLLRFVETGHKRYYVGLWITFLLGFGVLELNVVFPAIAAVYLFLFARRYLPAVAPMFLVSIAYTIWHRSAGKALQNDTYAMDFHPMKLLGVLAQYIELSLSAYPMAQVSTISKLQFQNAGAVVLVALLVFIGVMLWRRQWLVVFFLAWYGLALAPYLPLGNHVSDYYVTVPMLGLAMLGAWAIHIAWRGSTLSRVTAVVAVLLFVVPCGWQAWHMTRMWSQQSRRVRHLVRGIAGAHKLHPNKIIVLKGVDNDLFWTGVYDRPQLALGWTGLYITGDTERNIVNFPGRSRISDRFLPDAVLFEALQNGTAVVYDVSQPRLRNVTTTYNSMLSHNANPALPHAIDAGVPLFAQYRIDGWFVPSHGYCWTGKRATVRLRGPVAPGGQLALTGLVSHLHTKDGPLSVTATVNGKSLGAQTIQAGNNNFHLIYNLPDSLVGERAVEIAVEVDRTVSAPPDTRQVGLLFGTFEITP